MLLPLGLGTALPRFPFWTLLLTGLISLYSFAYMDEVKGYSKAVLANGIEKELQAASAGAMRDYCNFKLNKPGLCGELENKINEKSGLKRAPASNASAEESIDFATISQLLKLQEGFHGPELKSVDTKAVHDYLDLKEQVDSRAAQYSSEHALLGKGNVTPWTLVRYQFLHADLGHLLGNMFFFLVFGIYLEQVLSPAFFVGLFLIGGAISGLSECLGHESTRMLVGASGSVSAILGAFYLLFFRSELAVLLIYRRVFLPMSYSIPLIFVVQDVAAVAGGTGSNVAHLAHFVGFLVGAAFGYSVSRSLDRDDSTIYPVEKELERSAIRMPIGPERVEALSRVLRCNPGNFRVLKELLCSIGSNSEGIRSDREVRSLLNKAFRRYLGTSQRERRIRLVAEMLRMVPPHIPLSEVCSGVPQKDLLKIAERAENNRDLALSLVSLDLYLASYPRSQLRTSVAEHVRRILGDLLDETNDFPRKAEQCQRIREYAVAQPDSILASLIPRTYVTQELFHVRAA